MLIVLEGCDGTGKTSLAETLSALLNADIIHATADTPNDFAWFKSIIEFSDKKNVILDRAWWGQFVYQKPEERHLSDAERESLEKLLVEHNGKFMYVYAPRVLIMQRLYERKEQTLLPVAELLSRFDHMRWTAACPVLGYNTINGKVEQIYGSDSF